MTKPDPGAALPPRAGADAARPKPGAPDPGPPAGASDPGPPAGVPTTPRGRLRALIERNHGTHRGWVRLQLAHFDHLVGRLAPWTEVRLPRVKRVVFVCLGNINRSAFAHAVASRLGVQAASFGLATTTGSHAFETATRIAQRFGISLDAHRATHLTDYEYREGDLLAAMEVRHVNRLLDHGFAAQSIVLLGHWAAPMRLHIHDPHTLADSYFLTCFTILESAVRNLAVELRERGHPAAV